MTSPDLSLVLSEITADSFALEYDIGNSAKESFPIRLEGETQLPLVIRANGINEVENPISLSLKLDDDRKELSSE